MDGQLERARWEGRDREDRREGKLVRLQKKKTKTNRQKKNNYKNKLFFHPEWHSTNNWSKVSPCATGNSDQHFLWPYLQVIDSHSLCTVLQGFFALLNLILSWKWFYDILDMKYDRLKSSQSTGLLLMYLHCLLCSPQRIWLAVYHVFENQWWAPGSFIWTKTSSFNVVFQMNYVRNSATNEAWDVTYVKHAPGSQGIFQNIDYSYKLEEKEKPQTESHIYLL